MITGGIYSDYDNPPNSSMFVRAGGGCTTPKSKSSPVNESLSDIAKCLTNVLSSPRSSAGTSPAKSIDSRSKCYKQLGDLNCNMHYSLVWSNNTRVVNPVQLITTR